MYKARVAAGVAVIMLGFIFFFTIVNNMNDYFSSAIESPMHRYVSGDNNTEMTLKISDVEVVVSVHILNIIAVILSIMFFKAWAAIGSVIISAGSGLLTFKGSDEPTTSAKEASDNVIPN